MLIKHEQLEVGDEILVPSQARFIHYKVLSKPKKAGSTTYRCSTAKAEIALASGHKYYVRHFSTDSAGHNTRESVNLDCKDLWLLKRD